MDEDNVNKEVLETIEAFQLPSQELDFLVNATLNQELYYSVETTPYYHTIRLSPPCSSEAELCAQLKIEVTDLPAVRKFSVESLQQLDFLIFQFHGRRISTQIERDFFNHEKQIGWFLFKTENELVITWNEDDEILNSSLPNSKVIHLGPLHIPGLSQQYFSQLAKLGIWEDKFYYDDAVNGRAVFMLNEAERSVFLEYLISGKVEVASFFSDYSLDSLSKKSLSLADQVAYRSLNYFFEEVRLARKFWLELGIQNELN